MKEKKAINIYGPSGSGKTTILYQYHAYFEVDTDILTKYVYTGPEIILNEISDISSWNKREIFLLDEADDISNPEYQILKNGLENYFEQVVYATHEKLPSVSAYINGTC